MEAEFRLWPFALCMILVPGSLILWGVGAAHGIHWFGLIFAMGSLSITSTMGVTLSVNYLVDSFHDISGDGMSTVIIIRNTMSFAIGYGYAFPCLSRSAIVLADKLLESHLGLMILAIRTVSSPLLSSVLLSHLRF